MIIATGKLISEGFDCPYLDFLSLPISWKGSLQQYVDRLHRQYEGKKKVVVYDYCDGAFAVLKKMYQKRLKGYEMLGYEINESQLNLFETEI